MRQRRPIIAGARARHPRHTSRPIRHSTGHRRRWARLRSRGVQSRAAARSRRSPGGAAVVGQQIGPYQVLAALGAGGMGEVYRARDTKLGRDVAIKVLPVLGAADPLQLTRLHREAQLLAAINHPNIAAIYGFEDSGDTHGLVMELVEGPTLADRIAAGPLPVAEALLLARQIADALAAAHEQGIVHRDLKPANIKVRPDGTVKVLDFGLAKAIDRPG